MPEQRTGKSGHAIRVRVFGVVQGVGFRPFVYRLASRLGYRGWVKNVGPGVEIHLESGAPVETDEFLRLLSGEAPPLARIERVSFRAAACEGSREFRVERSSEGESFVFISPDIATCPECLEEIRTPSERRFRYPFTNCTNCGPRYTIVHSLPYDRHRTTMSSFKMCRECAAEYSNPLDRRYHAQPIACPACGPQVSLIDAKTGRPIRGGLDGAACLIKRGRIVAVKGLGGFHLVCDARNASAVRKLRAIKTRRTKPLALMAASLGEAQKIARVSAEEKKLLLSTERPIVLLRKKKDIPGIAPHLNEVGIMLPYTPLHHLLLERVPLVVATSSNKKDSPIIKERGEGLASLCDALLDHDRPIRMRSDDSVVKVAAGGPLFARRARGFVPYPQRVPDELCVSQHILALGAELKDTVSVYKNGYVITSQFLGDQDEYENHRYSKETIDHLSRLFDVKPSVVVSDLHPDFHTTRLARRMGLPHFTVQHHFAHALAPLLEHGVPAGKKILAVALDGYGYGQDGRAWGGEFLLADYSSYERIAHFKDVPLPGGDRAAREPWRMALAYLREIFGEDIPYAAYFKKISRAKVQGLMEMMRRGLQSPLTSSCGRLFDAASHLLGLAPMEIDFEAEAAMRLEAAAATARTGQSYPFDLQDGQGSMIISFERTLGGLMKDGRAGRTRLAALKFHNTLGRVILEVARRARREAGVSTLSLVGGVFLNRVLLERATRLLEDDGFRVLRTRQYSPNDESVSVGQIAYALARLKRGWKKPV